MDCGEAVRPGRTTSTTQVVMHHPAAVPTTMDPRGGTRGESMTETVNSGAKAARAAGQAGLSIARVFSTEGVHPYDELMWERRDVVQTNWKTGDTVFEQRGVEFPSTWSVNASTIVTTKYFRGAVGTDAREWSLKQLIA